MDLVAADSRRKDEFNFPFLFLGEFVGLSVVVLPSETFSSPFSKLLAPAELPDSLLSSPLIVV